MKRIISSILPLVALAAQANASEQIRIKPGMIRSTSIVLDEQCSKVTKQGAYYPFYEVGMTATIQIRLSNGVTLRQPFFSEEMYSAGAPDAATAFSTRTCPNVTASSLQKARKANFDTWAPLKLADAAHPSYDPTLGQCVIPILDVDYEQDGRINLMRAGQLVARCP